MTLLAIGIALGIGIGAFGIWLAVVSSKTYF